MHTVYKKRLLALAMCMLLAVPCAASAASFGEFASGVKNLTEAGKDVHSITKGNDDKQEVKQAPANQPKKKTSSKKSAPRNTERQRGG